MIKIRRLIESKSKLVTLSTQFKDNYKNGQGTYTFPDGGKYVGEWKDGIRRNGTSYDINGNLKVVYVNGNRITH